MGVVILRNTCTSRRMGLYVGHNNQSGHFQEQGKTTRQSSACGVIFRLFSSSRVVKSIAARDVEGINSKANRR